MRKKIDDAYIDAVRKAVDALGGQSDLARAAGVPPGTISAIINPKRKRQFLLATVYNRLYPFVSSYLPELPPPGQTIPGAPYYNNTINNITAPGNVVPAVAPVLAPAAPVDLTPGTIPAEVILHAMQGMEPEEKARFLKELYTSCAHETEETPEA